MPYPKGNRDEWISLSEIENRLSGPFTMIELAEDKDVVNKSFASLREYSKKFITPSAGGGKGKNDKAKGASAKTATEQKKAAVQEKPTAPVKKEVAPAKDTKTAKPTPVVAAKTSSTKQAETLFDKKLPSATQPAPIQNIVKAVPKKMDNIPVAKEVRPSSRKQIVTENNQVDDLKKNAGGIGAMPNLPPLGSIGANIA